jgi:hypothetical protein
MPLTALLGILNSRFARLWFERHAKQRGVNLEINGETLRRFPLPPRSPESELRLADLVQLRQTSADQRVDDATTISKLEREIDEAVCTMYGVERQELESAN